MTHLARYARCVPGKTREAEGGQGGFASVPLCFEGRGTNGD
jgi:hypothetical protein